MIELRWNWVYYPYLDAPNKQEESALKAGYIKVVSKDEADKVIADKDEEIAKLKAMLEYRNKQVGELKEQLQEEHSAKVDYKISSRDLSDGLREAVSEIRHHKYKRCLMMAKLSIKDDYLPWNMKWHKRWLEIAKKVKEA